MRETWPGARSGRISIRIVPLVVSRISVLSASCAFSVMDVLCLLEFSVVDETDGHGPARERVAEPIGERQWIAAPQRLRHGDAIGEALVLRRARRFIGDFRPAENLSLAGEAEQHR